jgi:hypothetical protein
MMGARKLGKLRMSIRHCKFDFTLGVWLVFVPALCMGQNSSTSQDDRMAYEQSMARVQEVQATFTEGPTNDLAKYETFVDGLLREWRERNNEYHARLTLAICPPLTGGRFSDKREYQVARKYVLAALEDATAIPLLVEIELARLVSKVDSRLERVSDVEFAKLRLNGSRVRLRAWKRLEDSIDPNFDQKEEIPVHPPFLPGLRFYNSGMSPDRIEDPVLRAKYIAVTAENDRRREKHTEQYHLRLHRDSFRKATESYIVDAYSSPPSNVDELNQLLDRYVTEDAAKDRILKAVKANADAAKK